MSKEKLTCSAPGCEDAIEIDLHPAPGQPGSSVYEKQRATIARNHGWVIGRQADTDSILQYCPAHQSDSIAGFAPF